MKFTLIILSLLISGAALAGKQESLESVHCLLFKNDKLVITNGFLNSIHAGNGSIEMGAPFNFHERIELQKEEKGVGAYIRASYNSKGLSLIKASIIDTGKYWSYFDGSTSFASYTFDKVIKEDVELRDEAGHQLVCRVNALFTTEELSKFDPEFDHEKVFAQGVIQASVKSREKRAIASVKKKKK